MGYLFVLIGVMALTAVFTTVSMVFGYHKRRKFQKAIAAGLILSVILCAFAGIYTSAVSNAVNDLTAVYEDLTLYQSTIERSTNEYVRYDYYEKITEYNEMFLAHQGQMQDKWFGALYPKGWDENITFIDFQLHGDSYYGD